MGGFKKEDVANYIAEAATEHAREIDAVKGDIKALETKNAEMTSVNEAQLEEKKNLLSRVDELSVKVSEGEAAKADLFALKEKYADLVTEKENLSSEILTLQNEISAKDAKIAQYEAREQEISRNKEQIANLELDARKRAEQMVEDTKEKMSKELEENRVYIESEKQKLAAYREKTLSEIENLVAEMSASYDGTKNAVQDFKTGFKAVVTELAREIDTISDASFNIEDAFNALKTDCGNMREVK